MRTDRPIRTAPARALVAALCLLLPAAALASEPLFGPQTFERTSGPPDTYEATFTAPGGESLLYLINGDEEGGQVSSASVLLNGREVVTASDLNANVPRVRKKVALTEGENVLAVSLEGEEGSFITLAIAHRSFRCDVVAGRLIIPYGEADALRLELHNGSGHRRAFRVLFFGPAGRLVAAGERRFLPPRGSISSMAESFIDRGSWTEGAVHVVFAGHCGGRLHGQAKVTNPDTGAVSVVSLQPAGLRSFPPMKPGKSRKR